MTRDKRFVEEGDSPRMEFLECPEPNCGLRFAHPDATQVEIQTKRGKPFHTYQGSAYDSHVKGHDVAKFQGMSNGRLDELERRIRGILKDGYMRWGMLQAIETERIRRQAEEEVPF